MTLVDRILGGRMGCCLEMSGGTSALAAINIVTRNKARSGEPSGRYRDMDGVKALEETVTAAMAEADQLPTEASIRQMINRIRFAAAALRTVSDSEAEAVARRIETRFTVSEELPARLIRSGQCGKCGGALYWDEPFELCKACDPMGKSA